MKMKKIILLATFSTIFTSFCENISLISNVYNQVGLIFKEDGGLNTESYFGGVYGGDGYMWGSLKQPFFELVPVVSNNYTQIADDWDAYVTNDIVSYTVLSAIGYSGLNVYTNFLGSMVTRYEQTYTTNDWETVRTLSRSYQTPMWNALLLHYDNVAVSNLILRIKSGATRAGDTKTKDLCAEILTGETREAYLLMKAAGAIE